MKIINTAAWEDYIKPLEALETAFRLSAMDIQFQCELLNEQKVVLIFRNGRLTAKKCIEGDSPACALLDVVSAIHL